MDSRFRSTIDGNQLLGAFEFASRMIADHREQLNAMNVFPVPDGDTGTNMAHTMNAAFEAATHLAASADLAVHRVALSIARGALMGAHGNSGAILSQILRGFAQGVDGCDRLDASDVARGLSGAASSAYKAVVDPVEGTMLTVIRGASRAAETASKSTSNVLDIFDAAAVGATESLATTPTLLEVLSLAHVVDAGGLGVAYMLRAIANHLRGDSSEIQIGENDQHPSLFEIDGAEGAGHCDESGYCTNFVLFGVGLDMDTLRSEFKAIGSSLVVAGDESLVKVHIHSDRPDKVLELALRFGRLDRVSIDNMDRQVDEIADLAAGRSSANVLEAEVSGKHAVVTFATGPGIARAFLSLGATTVLQSTPEAGDLLRILESMVSASVLLVPTSRELLAMCSSVQEVCSKPLLVVPADSIVGALTALSAMSLNASIETNGERATSALATTHGVEIATAAEDGVIDGIEFSAGETLCFVNSLLASAQLDLESALESVLSTFGPIDPDICTIFVSQNNPAGECERVSSIVENAFPEAELEVIDGGQAYYRYIIAIDQT